MAAANDRPLPTRFGDDPWRRTRFGLIAVIIVLAGGTIAYRLLGLSWVDAYYQTVITVSTVGYTEIGEDIGTTYRLVSSVVIFLGVGIALYTITVTFDGLMEGQLREQFGRNRMERTLDDLRDHVVVAGWGQVGQAITTSVRAHGEAVVVIDQDPDALREIECPSVVGDATSDGVLKKAGITRARGLIVALDSDAANLYVTLSARSLNPALTIVCRANSPSAEPKLMQAGADRVVNPHAIGGTRMASFMLQPHVADFLGESVVDGNLQMRLTETRVQDASPLVGQTLDASGLLEETDVTLLAIRCVDGSFIHHPEPDQLIIGGHVLITLGTPEQQAALRSYMARR